MIFIYILLCCICLLFLNLIKKIDLLIDLICQQFGVDKKFWGSDRDV